MPQVISNDQVLSVLSWPLVNQAVEQAMIATVQTHSNPDDPAAAFAFQPPRTLVKAGNNSQILFTMPCFVGNYELAAQPKSKADSTSVSKHSTLACKLVTSFSTNQQRVPALPNIMANILLLSEQTGELLCVMDGTQITAWRTAAASIVATKYLYFQRAPEFTQRAIKVAIIGCGVQGRAHALGMLHTYAVCEIQLWNRTTAKAEKLAEELRNLAHVKTAETVVHVAGTAAAAVADADVICVGTFADKALVELSMLKQGDVHINTVGAGQVHFGEVSLDIYANGKVYTDHCASAKIELKDLPAEIVDEVGQVIRKQSYPSKGGITIFQSLGMASEDATVAQAVYEALKRK